MSKEIQVHSGWDSIGIGASILCAVHCLLLPIAFSTLSVLGIELIENIYFEIATILLSLGAGILAFRGGYKSLRNIWPILVFVGAFLLLILGNLRHEEEVLFKSAAVVGLIVSHVANWSLGKKQRSQCTNHSD